MVKMLYLEIDSVDGIFAETDFGIEKLEAFETLFASLYVIFGPPFLPIRLFMDIVKTS